jgi:hypothetical protein
VTRLAAWARALVDADPEAVALRLTLLGLVLRPPAGAWIRAATLALAAVGLLWPRALRHPALWLALAVPLGARVVSGWPLGDNHAYLFVYWCAAAAIALRAAESRAALAWNARVLVGLVFAFATLWKVGLSDDFADGRFFRAVLVTDERFEPLARVAGGVNGDDLAALRAFVRAPVSGELPPLADPPREPTRLRRVAILATYWTLAIEGALALAFLWPGPALARLRDPLLLLFCATTFAFAPVEGFGWLLLAMGAAQSDPRRPRVRLAYVAVFALLLVYRELAVTRALPPAG